MSATTTIPVPEQWPPEVAETFEPVRHLGKGGFASVILGKRKVAEEGQPKFVALKVVGSKDVTRQEVGYAHREIDILSELDHPGIMKVLAHWEPPLKDHRCAAVMALSFARGPTLEQLLKKGGALSSVFGRVVCAQIIDVLAYVHSRAVIHRDIKPDNIIVTGAAYELAEIWDEKIVEGRVDNWDELTNKWKVTFVDFGFARALSPSDMTKSVSEKMRRMDSTPFDLSESGSLQNSSGRHNNSLGGSNSSRKSLGRSVSRTFNRQMSALGHRSYAAPEVMKGVKPNSQHNAVRLPGDEPVDLTNNLSANVSRYGMMADAYSAGSTIRYAMTGVPHNMTLAEAEQQQNPLGIFGCCLGSKKTADGKEARKVRFRPLTEISKEAQKLVEGLMKRDPEQRTSIRNARLYPWIDSVLSTPLPSRKEIDFLTFVKKDITATEE